MNIGTGELLLDRKKQSIALTLVISFVLLGLLVFYYIFAFIPIEGNSMENTIHHRQYCLVLRQFNTISRGDIIVLEVPNDDNKGKHDIIKRVVGLSGDKIIFMYSEDGEKVELYICKKGENKFKKQKENYIKEPMSAKNFKYIKDSYTEANSYSDPMKYNPNLTKYDLDTIDQKTYHDLDEYIIYVPDMQVYFLGDNRNVSRDSRYYGSRPKDDVKYKLLTVVY